MKEKIEEVKKEHPSLNFETVDYKIISDEGDEISTRLQIKGFKGNEELTLLIRDEDELNELITYPLDDLSLFKDYLGVVTKDNVQVLLNDIGLSGYSVLRSLESKELNIKIHYNRQELNLKLSRFSRENKGCLKFFSNSIMGAFRGRFRRPIIIEVNGLKINKNPELENETRKVLNSVLFDIEYNFGLSLETVNINSLLRRINRRKKNKYELPDEPINLVYKDYIPELIDYYHIGEKVDFLPFKFLCYFHIIEYFQDKSAYHIVSEKLKNIMLKPDFSLNIQNYVGQAINVFKKENEKHLSDKIKIERVFKQFVDFNEFKLFLENEELYEYFQKEVIFDCIKPLKISALSFESESRFYNTLMNRVYSLRCSIVHSNPDFDDSKAIPFLANHENIEKLRLEMEIMMELARTIITKTTY
tara:strand:+ start:4337 stop:5587 length:1251 start_codon:yes stop_codon:yes gene_type:complete